RGPVVEDERRAIALAAGCRRAFAEAAAFDVALAPEREHVLLELGQVELFGRRLQGALGTGGRHHGYRGRRVRRAGPRPEGCMARAEISVKAPRPTTGHVNSRPARLAARSAVAPGGRVR